MSDMANLLELGLTAHRAGRFDEAAKLYETILSREPGHVDAAYLLGKIAADCGRHQEAVVLFRWALEKRPDLAQLHAELACSLYGSGAAHQAIDAYRQALSLSLPPALKPPSTAPDPNQIVFAGIDPRMRHAVMARGLRDLGFRVTLIYKKEPNFAIGDYFSDWQRFQSAAEGLTMAFGHRPLCFHLFMIWGENFVPSLALARPGPQVVDLYDSLAGNYYTAPADHVLHQLIAVGEADGLVCRDPRTKLSLGLLGLPRSAPTIWFPEYLLEQPARPAPKAGPVTVVSVGDLNLRRHPEGVDHYSVAELLMKAGAHLHIYPSPGFQGASLPDIQKAHAEFLAIDPERCHIHPYLPFAEMKRTLAEYDFGLSVMPELLFGHPTKNHNPAIFPLCASSRLIDYLGAGLQVLLSRELHMQKFICRHFGRPAIDAQILLQPDLGEKLVQLRAASSEAASGETFLASRNIPRLVAFYRRIAGIAA